MLYTHTTNKNITRVKEEIRENAKEFSFGILKEYEFQQILQSKGFPIEKDITVFELCNPSAAQKVLTKHPELSVYLPCRISVYELGSQTLVSTIGLDDMLNPFELEDSFKTEIALVFENLKKLIASLA